MFKDVYVRGVVCGCEQLVRSENGKKEVYKNILYGHGGKCGHVSLLRTDM